MKRSDFPSTINLRKRLAVSVELNVADYPVRERVTN